MVILRQCLLGLLVVGGLMVGCARPNPVTIQLRKEKQALQDQLVELKRRNEAFQARIATLEQQVGAAPALPQSRLQQMFTVHEIRLGRLTGGTDLDGDRPGDEGLRIYLEPVDQTGDAIKATGHVVVEAFDLSLPTDNRIGVWEYGPEELKEAWRSLGPLHHFVLISPWQTAPRSREIAIKVTFRDELTGRTFTALKEVEVNPPPTGGPAAER